MGESVLKFVSKMRGFLSGFVRESLSIYLGVFALLAILSPLEVEASLNTVARSTPPRIARDPFRKPDLFDDIQRQSNASFHLSRIEQGRYVTRFQSGVKTVYSLDPGLQSAMKQFLKKNRVPYGAFVAMNPYTGKVLAMVEHSSQRPNSQRLALRATYPAASIFKVVTASALMEEKGVRPETYVVQADRRRPIHTTLEDAFAFSDNHVFGMLASRYLNVRTLVTYARRFLFDQRIPFALPVDVSEIHLKPRHNTKNRSDLAGLAAGFGDVGLSPLHAALIGSAIANDGRMVKPCLVDYVLDPLGRKVLECRPQLAAQAISKRTSEDLRQMMGGTVVYGTARRAFRKTGDHPALQSIDIGGKTGSLRGDDPLGHVTWFIGMAPLVHPEVVVSAVIVNKLSGQWKVKAADVASEGFLTYFKSKRSTHRA